MKKTSTRYLSFSKIYFWNTQTPEHFKNIQSWSQPHTSKHNVRVKWVLRLLTAVNNVLTEIRKICTFEFEKEIFFHIFKFLIQFHFLQLNLFMKTISTKFGKQSRMAQLVAHQPVDPVIQLQTQARENLFWTKNIIILLKGYPPCEWSTLWVYSKN